MGNVRGFNPVASLLQGDAARTQLGQNAQQRQITGLQNQLSDQGGGAFNPIAQQLAALSSDPLTAFINLDKNRQQAFIKDASQGAKFIRAGQPVRALELAQNRRNDLLQIDPNADTSDTDFAIQGIAQGMQTGDFSQVLQSLDQAAGIQLEKKEPNLPDKIELFRELQRIKREGTPEQIAEFRALNGLDKPVKLSQSAEKAIINSQDKFFKLGESARKMELLASDVERLDIGGGLSSTVSETFKGLLGSQDEVTNLRKQFNAIRASQATNNLPPGPASDKDIALALSGFPSENSNAGIISSFLRGQSKLARIDERFQEFKAEFIGQNNSVKGLIKAWKASVRDPDFLQDILAPNDPIKNTLSTQDELDEINRQLESS